MEQKHLPKLTVGMAHFEDYHGVWQTVHDLVLDHREVIQDVEIVVVDNYPPGSHGKETQGFLGWVHSGTQPRTEDDRKASLEQPWHPHSVKYVPFSKAVGTSQSRNEIFRQASAPYVLAIDCHVKLWPDSLKRLLDFYEENPDTQDLHQGVLVYDDLEMYRTHFDDVIRGEMWGTWGWDERGKNLDGDPFEIGGQGLGLFSCRKDAWLGFNEKFRGFGGEEMYIHEKYRQAGHKTLCLPFMRWIHRFGRPDGVKYPLERWMKVRNYILGYRELGLPLDRLFDYFVRGKDEDPQEGQRGTLRPPEWEALTEGTNP